MVFPEITNEHRIFFRWQHISIIFWYEDLINIACSNFLLQMEEFRKLLQHRVEKGEMKKRDLSGGQRKAAKEILVEAGIIGDAEQERELTQALRKKKVLITTTSIKHKLPKIQYLLEPF